MAVVAAVADVPQYQPAVGQVPMVKGLQGATHPGMHVQL